MHTKMITAKGKEAMLTKTRETADKIEAHFDTIENEIFNGDAFLKWRGSFDMKKVIIKKEGADVKIDYDIRLLNWPDGLSIKVYKHKALGVFAYLKDEEECQKYLNEKPVACRYWRESFYFSHRENLDSERYVLLEGNEMQDNDTHQCLEKIKCHLEEITNILSKCQ